MLTYLVTRSPMYSLKVHVQPMAKMDAWSPENLL